MSFPYGDLKFGYFFKTHCYFIARCILVAQMTGLMLSHITWALHKLLVRLLLNSVRMSKSILRWCTVHHIKLCHYHDDMHKYRTLITIRWMLLHDWGWETLWNVPLICTHVVTVYCWSLSITKQRKAPINKDCVHHYHHHHHHREIQRNVNNRYYFKERVSIIVA